jgi:hypothetical protein
MLLAVTTPADALPKAGSENVTVANSVPLLASVVAVGAEPVLTCKVPAPEPPSTRAATAFAAADLARSLIFMEPPLVTVMYCR